MKHGLRLVLIGGSGSQRRSVRGLNVKSVLLGEGPAEAVEVVEAEEDTEEFEG